MTMYNYYFDGTEFFKKIATPSTVETYYLTRLDEAQGFSDKLDYLTTQDILLYLDYYLNTHQTDDTYNLNGIMLIEDTEQFDYLKQLFDKKTLGEQETFKLLLKLQPHFNTESPVSGIHVSTLFMQNRSGVLHIFIYDAGGGIYFDQRDGFHQLKATLLELGNRDYIDVKIIVSSCSAQEDWRSCFIYAIKAISYFSKHQASLFEDLEQHLVSVEHKVADYDNEKVHHLQLDKTPPELMKLSARSDASLFHPRYQLNEHYYKSANFLKFHQDSLVSQKKGLTLQMYQRNSPVPLQLCKKLFNVRQNIHQRMQTLGILNTSNEFNLKKYQAHLMTLMDNGVFLGCFTSMQCPSDIQEIILRRQYQLDNNRHYSMTDVSKIDYITLSDTPGALPDEFKSTHLYASIAPIEYTQAHRSVYFSSQHAQEEGHKASAHPNRTVLWSGGYIPNHPYGYGLGRIVAENAIVYFNNLLYHVHGSDYGSHFSTVAMTPIGLPVLNPLWNDQETPLETKIELTPYYLKGFITNAQGTITLNVDDTDPDSFFRRVEINLLMQNCNVTRVRVVQLQPNSDSPIFLSFSKTEWLDYQKNQWAYSIVIRHSLMFDKLSNATNIIYSNNEILEQQQIQRFNQALLDAYREEIQDQSDTLQHHQRVKLYTNYMHKFGTFFKNHMEENDWKKGCRAKWRYCVKLIHECRRMNIDLSKDENFCMALTKADVKNRSFDYHQIYLQRWQAAPTYLNYFTWLDFEDKMTIYPRIKNMSSISVPPFRRHPDVLKKLNELFPQKNNIVTNCLDFDTIISHFAAINLFCSKDESKWTKDMFEQECLTFKQNINIATVEDLGVSIAGELNRFFEVYTTIGPEYAKNFDCYPLVCELIKQTDMELEQLFEYVHVLVFDVLYTNAIRDYLIPLTHEPIEHIQDSSVSDRLISFVANLNEKDLLTKEFIAESIHSCYEALKSSKMQSNKSVASNGLV